MYTIYINTLSLSDYMQRSFNAVKDYNLSLHSKLAAFIANLDQTSPYNNLELMDVVKVTNPHGVEYLARIIGFSCDGVHLVSVDKETGGIPYWQGVDHTTMEKASLRDVFNLSVIATNTERYTVSNRDAFDRAFKLSEYTKIYDNGYSCLYQDGCNFISYTEGDVIELCTTYGCSNLYADASLIFHKEYA